MGREPQDDQSVEESTRWYWVEYILRCDLSGKPSSRVTHERAVLLVRANSQADADSKGLAKAKSKEHSYTVEGGGVATWKFVAVERVEPVFDDEIVDGTEVYSSFFVKQLRRR